MAGIGWPAPPPPITESAELPPSPARPPTKVLHVITRFSGGAGGNTLLSVLGADRDRYESWVVAAARDPEAGPLWRRAESHGVRTVKLRRLREVISPLDDLIVLAQLTRLIRRERFSIVHTHASKAGVLGRLAGWLGGSPAVVHTVHGPSTHQFMSAPRRRAYLAIERGVRRITDAFLAVSPEVAREAVETRVAPPGGISVAPSAVELDEIPVESSPHARQELGVPPGIPLVGTVGRLDHAKAPLDFVRMAKLVAEARPGTQFAMVGDGPLSRTVREEASRLGVEITFAGFRLDAPVLAASFDVFVISSLHEGLGRALTEALASGRPVAATTVNGVVDLVEHGATGLLSPPSDPASLARNVTWLLEHPVEARQMGQAGAARVRILFRPEVMCAVIEQTYARLLGLPKSSSPDGGGHRPDLE